MVSVLDIFIYIVEVENEEDVDNWLKVFVSFIIGYFMEGFSLWSISFQIL